MRKNLLPETILGKNLMMLVITVSLASLYLILHLLFHNETVSILNQDQKSRDHEAEFDIMEEKLLDTEILLFQYAQGLVPSSKPMRSAIVENVSTINLFLKEKHFADQRKSLEKLLKLYKTLESDTALLMGGNLSEFRLAGLNKDLHETIFVMKGFVEKIEQSLEEKRLRDKETVLKNLRRSGYLLLFIVLLIFILVTLPTIFRRLIKSRLLFLQKNISEFSGENFDHRIIYDKNDEILPVVESFNTMIETIKERNAELIESEAAYRAIFNSVGEAIFVHDMDSGAILDVNEKMLDLFKCTREDAVKMHPGDFSEGIFPYTTEEANKKIRKAIQTGSNLFEWRSKDMEGGIFWCEVNLIKALVGEKKRIIATVRDISDRKESEERLIQIQKMETIGSLAGAIAHDFNNILGGLVGTLSIMKFKKQHKGILESDELDHFMSVMERSARKASDMVTQILALSKKETMDFTTVNLKSIIRHAITICENSFDKSIVIRSELPREDATVRADATHLEQVILNIMINSSHALTIMRKDREDWGGNITVSLKKAVRSIVEETEEEKFWHISIRDDGIGMKRETLERVFDPFFTTKEKGEGEGLGLTMAFNIVRQHEGFIELSSYPGKGTATDIFIPATEKEEKPIHVEERIPEGSGLILIIDDEEIIREMASSMLKECGYTTIEAENGREGVEIYKEKKDEIEAVILDMVMPVMSGRETFKELIKIDPEIKVLMSSGFKRDGRVQETMALGIKDFIKKPFSLQELAVKIDGVINRKKLDI